MNQNAGRVVTKARPSTLLQLTLLQLAGTVVFSLALYICFDLREALSAFFGGLIAIFASAFSAWQLYRSNQREVRNGLEAEPAEILVRFYVSVILKIAFSLIMIAICVIFMQVSMLPFIIAYLIAAVVINWLALLLPG